MVSYSRARAEGLDVDCKVGLLTRVERMLILCAGLILNRTIVAVWVVAVLANLTALQRMRHVYRVIREQERGSDA
jgi:CDP-diacylglycerol--glycerol-3-phosphate 3-phosphatidyltransferase